MSEISLIELRNTRLGKIEALRQLGINPYPSRCQRTDYAQSIIDQFEHYEGKSVIIAGRLMSLRKQGGLQFGHIQDQTGKIQLFIRKDNLQSHEDSPDCLGFTELKLLDLGDFIEAEGTVVKTQKGEISVKPEKIRLLTKSLRPLPDKWAGLKDREMILRKRYLHTTMEPTHKTAFHQISNMLAEIRNFLNQRGFLEFHTPILQPQYGGGTARPFLTHLNALNCRMYLSISHELYLKRLIAAGFDKVYTVGRYFRNEGVDKSHHPEFSMIETMTAYENYEYNMNLVEELFRHIAIHAFGKTQYTVRGHIVDFAQPWKRIMMADAVLAETGIDFRQLQTVEQANSALQQLGIHEIQESIGFALVKAFEEKVEATLITPTLVYGHPVDISPLAKPMDTDPRFAERFEIFIGGMECGDNWSEQNDPVQLLALWKAKYEQEDIDPENVHPLDFDFVEMLEHGMPPTTGIGPGIERMAMIFTEQENIDDVIFFPIMRPTTNQINQKIYELDKIPTQDLIGAPLFLTVDEFNQMMQQGILSVAHSSITISPHLQIWSKSMATATGKANGFIEIEGLMKQRTVHISGYAMEFEPKLPITSIVEQFIEQLKSSVVTQLKTNNTSIQVELTHDVEVEHI